VATAIIRSANIKRASRSAAIGMSVSPFLLSFVPGGGSRS
jgi:hypothetical protein